RLPRLGRKGERARRLAARALLLGPHLDDRRVVRAANRLPQLPRRPDRGPRDARAPLPGRGRQAARRFHPGDGGALTRSGIAQNETFPISARLCALWLKPLPGPATLLLGLRARATRARTRRPTLPSGPGGEAIGPSGPLWSANRNV